MTLERMFGISVVATALLIGTAAVAQKPLSVDPAASKLIWTGRNVTGAHSGTIDVATGTIDWNDAGLLAATMTLDMTSIKNTDMKEEMAKKLEGHLRSPDFFNVAEFATAEFKTTSVQKIEGAETGKSNYTVTGELTVKGITKPISFDVLAWRDGKRARVAGTVVFNRADFDVRYRSSRFFSDIGDKLIEDNVELTFDLSTK